jgi:hypothetical protein
MVRRDGQGFLQAVSSRHKLSGMATTSDVPILTAADLQDLERLEGTIRASRAAIGAALLEIHDRKLYRASATSGPTASSAGASPGPTLTR